MAAKPIKISWAKVWKAHRDSTGGDMGYDLRDSEKAVIRKAVEAQLNPPKPKQRKGGK